MPYYAWICLNLSWLLLFCIYPSLSLVKRVPVTFGHIKLYSHKEKAGFSFEITNEKMRLFLSMLLLSECYKLPDLKFIGRRTLTLFCNECLIQCLVISLSVFFGISIFVTTKNLINKTISRSSFPWLISAKRFLNFSLKR